MMKIDKKTYKINDINYHKEVTKKNQIVISFSLRKNHNHIIRLQHKEFGLSKRWNTYTVGRNGDVFQHYNDKYYSEYLNVGDGDKQSISIVLENMGSLIPLNNDIYVNWLNETCDIENVVDRSWLGYSHWEKINDIQLNNLVELCVTLCEKHKIPKRCIDFNHYHKDISKYKGIVFAGNYIDDSCDINPLFDINQFNGLLNEKYLY